MKYENEIVYSSCNDQNIIIISANNIVLENNKG